MYVHEKKEISEKKITTVEFNHILMIAYGKYPRKYERSFIFSLQLFRIVEPQLDIIDPIFYS